MAEPEEPEELHDVSDVESIQNLDTARMTLRWALERLRAVEKLNRELEAKADWEFKMRLKSETDFKAQWELERARFEEVQRKREEALEKGFATKLVEWERWYKRAEEEYERKGAELERVEKSRLAELAQKEADFDRFCALQKEGAETARRQIRAEALKDAEDRFQSLQKLTEDRMNALSGTWQRERESLLKDLEAWRGRAEEALTRALELERTARNAEELSRQTAKLADDRELEYKRLSQSWQVQREAYEVQLGHWQDQATQQEARAAELEKGRRFLEDQAHAAGRLAEDRQADALKMVDAWERQRATFEEQIKLWKTRAAEADQLAYQARSEAAEARGISERSEAEARRLAEAADKAAAELSESQGRFKANEAEGAALAARERSAAERVRELEGELAGQQLDAAEDLAKLERELAVARERLDAYAAEPAAPHAELPESLKGRIEGLESDLEEARELMSKVLTGLKRRRP